MSGFFFQGVRESPNGDLVPSFPISEEAHRRIRERWSTLQLTGPNGDPIVGQQREAILEETVLDDALWQFWLSNDLASWQMMPMDEKLWFLSHCVRDGRWWREWAIVNIEFGSWPWQKRLAFERAAVRESINAESSTPTSKLPDAARQVVAENMVRWREDFDLRNPKMSPYDVPQSYVGLVFETISQPSVPAQWH